MSMAWRGSRFMRHMFARRWRNTADSATLAHAIHKKRMRQRALRIISSRTDIGIDISHIPLPVAIVTGLETGIVNSVGHRVFPEVEGNPIDVIGKFIGEIIHTYNATWDWTGAVWRQRF